MGIVTGYTKNKMDEIANSVVNDAEIVGDNLILKQVGGTQINAGSTRGAKGDKGDAGPAWSPHVNGAADPAVDWNSLTTIGLHPALMHGVTNPSGPGSAAATYYYVMVYGYNGGYVTQVAQPYTSGYPICYRSNAGGVWNAWELTATTPAISKSNYGTLDNSGMGGVPYGGYIKHQNGVLECWVSCRIVPSSNSVTTRLWTFPIPFLTWPPSVTVTAQTTSTALQTAVADTPTVMNCNIGVIRTNTANTNICARAIGFWS